MVEPFVPKPTGPSGVPFIEVLELGHSRSRCRTCPSGVPFIEMLEYPPLKKPLYQGLFQFQIMKNGFRYSQLPFRRAGFQEKISGIQLRIIDILDKNRHLASAFLPRFS